MRHFAHPKNLPSPSEPLGLVLGKKALRVAALALAFVGTSFAQGQGDALLKVPNGFGLYDPAWRQLAQALRPCIDAQGGPFLPDLPPYLGKDVQVLLSEPLAQPGLASHGYWHRLGRRASDGALFIVSIGGMDGAMHVFGPVQTKWACVNTVNQLGWKADPQEE